MAKLAHYKTKHPNTIIQLFGDFRQLDFNFKFRSKNLMGTYLLHTILGDDGFVFEQPYLEESGRYSNKWRKVLQYLLKHHRLPPALKLGEKLCSENITFTRFQMRQTNKYIKGNKPLTVGDPLITTKKVKTPTEHDIPTSQRFEVKSISSRNKPVIEWEGKDIELNWKDWDYAHAVTCHRHQGRSITHPYTIHEATHPLVSLEWIYTALSRVKPIDEQSEFEMVNIKNFDKVLKHKWIPQLNDHQYLIQKSDIKDIKPVPQYYYIWEDPVDPQKGEFYLGVTDDLELREQDQKASEQTEGLVRRVIGESLKNGRKAREKIEYRFLRDEIRRRGKNKTRNKEQQWTRMYEYDKQPNKQRIWGEIEAELNSNLTLKVDNREVRVAQTFQYVSVKPKKHKKAGISTTKKKMAEDISAEILKLYGFIYNPTIQTSKRETIQFR